MDVTSTAVANILNELRKIYGYSDRAYHNQDHIDSMLAKLEESRHIAEHPDRLTLVIWFHDAVYDPKRNDNELKSAELWSLKMRSYLDEEPVQWGSRAILATIDHWPNFDSDIQLLLDLDLAALGALWEVFQKDSQNIRQEYKHIPDDLFLAGRKEFLKKLLERKRIYGTDYWHERLENKARENIERTLDA